MRRRWALITVVLSVLSACGGSTASGPIPTSGSTAGATQGPPSSTAPGFGSLDVCALLDQSAVQALTGESVRFVADGRRMASESRCFWGAAVPGVPAYVEVVVGNSPPDLSKVGFNGCASSPVAGAGAEAKGGTCTWSGTSHVWVIARDQGVMVTVIVNEPSRALTPDDLVATAQGVLSSVR